MITGNFGKTIKINVVTTTKTIVKLFQRLKKDKVVTSFFLFNLTFFDLFEFSYIKDTNIPMINNTAENNAVTIINLAMWNNIKPIASRNVNSANLFNIGIKYNNKIIMYDIPKIHKNKDTT
jgi:hypothetical protein